MKRIVLTTLSAVLLAVLCTGCDFIRASLGKPTSADLELLRLAEQSRLQEAVPATEPAEAPAADSASIREPAPDPEPEAAPAPAVSMTDGSVRQYYAVVGAFREDAGVQKYVNLLQEKGFNVHLFDFKSGLTAVCTEGSDDLAVVQRDMAALKAAGIDSWLYNTNKQLHK